MSRVRICSDARKRAWSFIIYIVYTLCTAVQRVCFKIKFQTVKNIRKKKLNTIACSRHQYKYTFLYRLQSETQIESRRRTFILLLPLQLRPPVVYYNIHNIIMLNCYYYYLYEPFTVTTHAYYHLYIYIINVYFLVPVNFLHVTWHQYNA